MIQKKYNKTKLLTHLCKKFPVTKKCLYRRESPTKYIREFKDSEKPIPGTD